MFICIATIFLYSLCSSLFHYTQFDCIPFYCIVTTFVVSAIVSHQHKLDMVHVQNSTLAGGVAVGSVCNLLVGPHGALLIGTISAIISVLGYRYLSVGSYFKRFVQCVHIVAMCHRHNRVCRMLHNSCEIVFNLSLCLVCKCGLSLCMPQFYLSTARKQFNFTSISHLISVIRALGAFVWLHFSISSFSNIKAILEMSK